LARGLRIHLLVSTAGRDKRAPGGARRRANSVFLFGPTGRIAGRYDKVRLLPFIEYLPLRGWVPWPSWIAPAMEDAVAGESSVLLAVGEARFAVQLCWENLFPGSLQSAAREPLDFVVSMTNEAFTGSEAGRRQLYAINAMRALENGTPLLRAATTAAAAVLDERGAELARERGLDGRDLDAIGLALADVPLGAPRGFYARHGDWLVALAALVAAAATVVAARSRARGVPR
jgi:apolipoprotein N-acyltransferase